MRYENKNYINYKSKEKKTKWERILNNNKLLRRENRRNYINSWSIVKKH